jgi:hypothetical protein
MEEWNGGMVEEWKILPRRHGEQGVIKRNILGVLVFTT